MVIYNCISAAEILLALVCISRVVYLEPGMSGRRNKILFAVAFLVPTLFVQICPGMSKDIFSAFPVCLFCCLHGDRKKGKKNPGNIPDGSCAWVPDGDRIRILCGPIYADGEISVRRRLAVCSGRAVLDRCF